MGPRGVKVVEKVADVVDKHGPTVKTGIKRAASKVATPVKVSSKVYLRTGTDQERDGF